MTQKLNKIILLGMLCFGCNIRASQDTTQLQSSFDRLVNEVIKLDKKVRKLRSEVNRFDYLTIEPNVHYQSIGLGALGVLMSSALLYKLLSTNKSLPTFSSLWSLYNNPAAECADQKIAGAYMLQKIGLCCAQLVCLSALLVSAKYLYLQGLNPQKALRYAKLAQLVHVLRVRDQQLRAICSYLNLKYENIFKNALEL